MGTHPPSSFIITYLGLVSQSVSQSVSRGWLAFFYLEKGKKRENKSRMPMKTPWPDEEREGEKDKDNIIDDDHEATASETLLSKPARRETTTNNTNIPFPHYPPYSSKQQRHPHHHQTRLILLLLTSILILCPCIFLLGFALGSSRHTITPPPQSTSIINDDNNINDNNNTNQPYFSHPSNPSPPPLPPLHPPLHLKEENDPFPPTPSLQQKVFNGSFFHETKFRAKASPEVDRVWEDLGINCSFISSLSSAKKNRLIFFLSFVFFRSKYPHPTTPRTTSRFETESTCPCEGEIWGWICGEFGGVASFALSCMFDAFFMHFMLWGKNRVMCATC